MNRIIKHIPLLIFILLNILPVYANSSWYWFAGNPITILPYIIIGTLFVEIFSLIMFNKIKQKILFAITVIIANFASFLLPYIYMGLNDEMELNYGFIEMLNYNIDKLPMYIINIGYLIVTLVIEIPIVYAIFNNKVENKRKFICSIAIINIITTIIIAIIEHIIYKGKW
jgi:hypothetical protein